MAVILRLLLLYAVVGMQSSSKAVRRSRMQSFPIAETVGSLRVKRGMFAYLHTSFFKIRVNSEYCKIVLSQDPFCVRVGDLSRTTFPCDFEANTIKYVHNGSPIYKNDCIKMEMYIFTRKDTILQVLSLDVTINDTPSDYSLRMPVITLAKPGETSEIHATQILPFKLLSSSFFKSCWIHLNKRQQWPLHGELTYEGQIIQQLRTNCTEFGLKYHHDGSQLPDTDYLTLSAFYLREKDAKPQLINYYLTVKLRNGLQNTPPILMSRVPRLRVTEYSITVIRSLHLQAVDFGSRPNQLLIRIQRTSLTRSTGYIAHIDQIETPLRGFYQSDIDQGKIVFISPKGIARRKILTIFFKAVDSYGLRSNLIHISLLIVTKQKRHLSVLHNPGIYLLEGQSRVLSNMFLKLTCSSKRCDRVKIDVWNGPQHGSLLKRGNSIRSFKYGDVGDRQILYRHDDSETTRDSIVLVASDRGERTYFTMSIKIEPKDDTPPALSTRRDIVLEEGSVFALNNSILNAVDSDSPSASIHYQVTSPPLKGRLLKRSHDNSPLREEAVTDFSQTDLIAKSIVYQASRQKAGSDRFLFRVHDLAKPPNYSGTYSMEIWINNVDQGAPFPISEKQCLILTNETERYLSFSKHLQYSDGDSMAKDIKFKILEGPNSYPKDLKSKLMYTSPFGFLFQVNEFTQADVDYNKIHLDIGSDDIGPRKHIITFRFVVKDAVGNESPPNECIIEVLPVNNKPPLIKILKDVSAVEGDKVCINSTNLQITDEDSNENSLLISITEVPAHGKLSVGNKTITKNVSINARDLKTSCLLYSHYGKEEHRDGLRLSVSDGLHKATSYLSIHVLPVDNLLPYFDKRSSMHLEVKENSSSVITPSIVKAIDFDTRDEGIKMYLLKSPKYGFITVDGNRSSMLTQQDINTGRVLFVHRNQSFGFVPTNDSFTLGLCPSLKSASQSVINCNVNETIVVTVSVHSSAAQRPRILEGEILVVSEGGQSVVSNKQVRCNVVNKKEGDIEVHVVTNASFGFLQFSGREIGSELIIKKKITQNILCSAIQAGKISYVQSIHAGVEPRNDSIQLQVLNSGISAHKFKFPIKIYSINDEPPEIFGKRVIALDQGESLRILRSHVNISDLDTPSNQIRLLLQTRPKSGSILYICQSRKMVWRKLTTKVKVPFHFCAFVYKHDGSSSKVDQFKIVATDGQFYTTSKVKVSIHLKYGAFNVVNQQDVIVDSFKPVQISSKHLLSEVQGISAKLVRYQVLKPLLYGTLSLTGHPTYEGSVTSFTQDDVDKNILFYHLKERPKDLSAPEKMVLRVLGAHFKERKLYVRIDIKFPKETPLHVTSSSLEMYQGQETAITPDHLKTTTKNESVDADDIRYRVIKDPAIGVLKIARKGASKAVATHFFTQEDINKGRLLFQVPQQHNTENGTDLFEFSVSAGNSFALGRIVINILYKGHRSILTRNTLLLAKKGRLTLITPLELRVKEELNPNNVVYEVFLEPKYGSFLLDGRRIMGAFTQQHINELRVGYVCYSNSSRKDHAVLRVKTESITGHTEQTIFKFSILLQPLQSLKLKLINYKNVTAIEELGLLGLGTLVGQRHLLTITCNGTANDQILYKITKQPRLGILLNITSGKKVKDKIRQHDISGNRIAYVNLEKGKAYEDSFQFNVVFGNCTPLLHKTLFIKWAVVSLSKRKTTYCNGEIHLVVDRKGFNEQMAMIDIHLLKKELGKEKLIVYKHSRSVFNKGSSYLVTTFKVSSEEIDGNQIYIHLENGFNVAIDRQQKEMSISKESLFKKCCETCKGVPPEPMKAKEDEGEETKQHALIEIPLRPHRSPSSLMEDLGLRNSKSPNERQIQGDVGRRRHRNRKRRVRCPEGWEEFRKSCYKIFPNKKRTWRKAAKICLTRYEAMLFFPKNQAEERFISRMHKEDIIWLGIRRNKRGHWLWSDGSAVQLDGRNLINISSREDGRVRSLCGILHPDGRWNIKDCRSQRYNYVCKKPRK